MPDVKKLITGFLIIVTAASSAALILSATGSGSSLSLLQNSAAAPVVADQNAFVPTQSDVFDAVAQNDPNVAAELNDPTNLTTNFTQAFLNGLSVVNPNGIQTDSDGNLDLSAPDATAMAAQIKNNPALNRVAIPNWDAQVNAQSLNVSNSASVGDYNSAINTAFSKDFVQSGAESLVGQQNLDPSNFAAITPSLDSAVTDVAQVPTPSSLANFQKSLVAMMVYEKNMADLGTLAGTDPVKAAVVYQAEEVRYNQVLQNFNSEFQSASSKGLLTFGQPEKAGEQNSAMAFIDSMVGIQTAHAQWITFDPSNFAQWILQTINAIILQILKNTLTAFIQQRVLKWIQGSGAPMFVQQFGNQLVNVAQAKALSSVNTILVGAANSLHPGYISACPNIGQLLGPTIASLGLVVPPTKQVPFCSLTVSASQLTNFYKNFNFSGANVVQGGSWNLYAQILNPSNNYYGTLLQTQDYVGQQSAQAAQVAQTKQVANQGFSQQEVCDDGSDPNGVSTSCGGGEAESYQWVCASGETPVPQTQGDGTTKYLCLVSGGFATYQLGCSDGSAPVTTDNFGLCEDGSEPRATTPGQVTHTALNSATGAALTLTTSANSIVGVLAGVATSLLNTIVQAGVSAAVNAGTQGLTSITLSATAGGSSSNGGVAATPPAQPTGGPSIPPTQCYPKTPQCSSGVGGQCSSGFMGGTLTFSATGADSINFNWSVGQAHDANGNAIAIVANPNVASTTAIFSTYFTDPGNFILPTTSDSIFPITVPVNVTGSDGNTDTCVAVITQ